KRRVMLKASTSPIIPPLALRTYVRRAFASGPPPLASSSKPNAGAEQPRASECELADCSSAMLGITNAKEDPYWGRSLNHHGGLLDHRPRYHDAKSLGGLEIDTHIHTRRSLNREIARLGAFENLVYQTGRPAVHIENVSSIRDKTTT